MLHSLYKDSERLLSDYFGHKYFKYILNYWNQYDIKAAVGNSYIFIRTLNKQKQK